MRYEAIEPSKNALLVRSIPSDLPSTPSTPVVRYYTSYSRNLSLQTIQSDTKQNRSSYGLLQINEVMSNCCHHD
jgi:hypothetical protein